MRDPRFSANNGLIDDL